MAGVAQITLTGNLASDPELRFGQNGKPSVNFRVIANRSKFNQQTNQWEDNGQLSPSCVAFDRLAENIAETLVKGMRVIVMGDLEQESYTDKNGEKRSVLKLWVTDVGPSLKNATAQVTKTVKPGNGNGNQSNSFDNQAWGGYADTAPPF